MRGLALTCVVSLFAISASCALPSRDARAAADTLPKRWHYDVSINAALTQIDVKLCFEGDVGSELRAGKDEAAPKLRYARWLSPGREYRLPVRDGRIQLPRRMRDGCVGYGIELTDSSGMGALVRRVGSDVLASPNVWLWRPQQRAGNAQATLRFQLPQGIRASIPWPAQDGVHTLTSEAFHFDSYAAFGHFLPFTLRHRDTTLDVTVLDGELSIQRAEISRWLKRTVEIVSGVEGKFPTSRAQILIVPSGRGGDPVQFGMVARGGAGSIMLFVSAGAREPELTRDWILPHELSHLLLPQVKREQAWLSEGLATYYQEVLLSRAGEISERETLHSIARALASARRQGTGRMLGEESKAMHETHAYRPVYWGGAAYFLLADVELRRRSNGRQSLDSVLTALHRRTSAYTKTWNAEDLLRELDALAGMALFVPLAEQMLARPFPAYETTLQALGVGNAGTALDDQAPLAAIRSAIFAPRPSLKSAKSLSPSP